MNLKHLVFSFLATLLLGGTANAWEANLPSTALEKNLIVVDKGKGEFFYLEKNGKEITRLHYPSIHGEVEGDKQVEGDLKTPEGVYFVRGKIQIPLDFTMYGNHAYALNYPNPVDKLKGKTGGGIWIHSKGNPIKGQVTQGCVAIDLNDIKALDAYLEAGTPVVIAQSVRSGFHKREELPFEKRTTNVAITHRERDGAVVSTKDIEKAEQDSSLEESVPELSDSASLQNTEKKSVQETEQETANDISQSNKNIENEEEEKSLFAQMFLPKEKVKAEELLPSDELADEKSAQEVLAPKEEKEVEQETSIYVPDDVPVSADTSAIYQATIDWNNAWASRSKTFFDFYNKEAYTKTEGSFEKFKAQKEGLFSVLSWIYIAYDEVEVLEGPDYFVSWFKQYYVAPNHKTEGIRRLYWMKDSTNTYKIVAMEWFPKTVGLEHKLNDKIKVEVPVLIENWRQAWEMGDINAYTAFYSPYAVQDNRKGIKEIKEQKQSIWKVKQPKKVVLRDIKMQMLKEGLRVEMLQEYEDKTGYKDKGVKILILHPKDSGWEIYRESWRRV